MADLPKSKPPLPVVRPSGSSKKPFLPVDHLDVMRISQTTVFTPKNIEPLKDIEDNLSGNTHEESVLNSTIQTAAGGGTMIGVPAKPLLEAISDTLIDPDGLATVQIPEQLFFEAGLILPQLASGKIILPLELILAQVPSPIAKVGVNGNEQVRLPLASIVPYIPSEMLKVKGQIEEKIDPNFVQNPFWEAKKKAAVLQPPQVALPPSTISNSEQAQNQPAEPSVSPDSSMGVKLDIRTLLKCLPDSVLSKPREMVMANAGDETAQLPFDLIVPQLGSGKIAVNYSILHPFLPPDLVIGISSMNEKLSIILPLDHIVPQIPTEMLAASAGQRPQIPEDSEIPADLFIEKNISRGAVQDLGARQKSSQELSRAPAEAETVEILIERQRPLEPADLEIFLTEMDFDETRLMERINRLEGYQLIDLNGISRELAKKILQLRNRKKDLVFEDLKEISLSRKSLLRLSSMPEVSGIPNVSLLNRLLMLNDQRVLKVQEIIETIVTQLGLEAGMMVTEDGLILAGQPPEGFDKQMVSAFIPQVLKRLSRGIEPSGVGKISRLTLIFEKHRVSLFRAPGIFLLFWHSFEKTNRQFFKRMERLTEELSLQNLSPV